MMQNLGGFVYIFLLTHPTYTAEKLYREWKRSKILREYRRPSLKRLKIMTEEIIYGLSNSQHD